jgi:hypothetical protein
MELLNNKINNIIENKLFSEKTMIEVNNTVKSVNDELLELFTKIEDCVRNNLIDLNLFNDLQTYMNSLNYFQTLALSHIFAIVLMFILLIDLMSIYFSDYLIDKFKGRYPRIHKLMEIRRKFKLFYLIKDIIIIFIVLIALLILNIMLFNTFTL